MGGGLESRCVGRVYGVDSAVHSTIRTVHTVYKLCKMWNICAYKHTVLKLLENVIIPTSSHSSVDP